MVTNIHNIFREDKKIENAICGDTVDIILKMQKEEDFD